MCLCVHFCLTLCDPIFCSLPDSSVHGIFQARRLEWAALSLLQGIFPIQGSNLHLLCLLHCQVDSLPLSHQGSPMLWAKCCTAFFQLILVFPSFLSEWNFCSLICSSPQILDSSMSLPPTCNHLSVWMLSHFICVQLFVSMWTIGQALLSMGFSRQEYWSGFLYPPPGDLPHPGIEPESPALKSGFFTHWATWEVFDSFGASLSTLSC